LEAVHRYSSEARAISYLTIDAKSLGEVALPAEDALKTFFEERKGAFRAPEYRKVTLLTLAPADLTDTAGVPEADVRARFEQQPERYVTPEERTVDQLRFPTMEAAADAKEKLTAGTNFDQLVAEQGQGLDSVSLGTLTRNQIIDKVVGDAAFALAEGEVSAPVAGTFGPALVRVRAIKPGASRSFEDAREELTKELAAERAVRAVQKRHDELEDERSGGMTLAEIAEKSGLRLRTVDAVSAEGKDPADQTVDLPAAKELLAKAFESDVGVDNDPLALDGGGYVWFEIADILPARERTFDEARQRVEAAWRNEETAKRLKAKADDLIGRLRGGQGLTEVAAAEKLQVQTSDGITRERGAGDLGRVVANSVFATPVNGFGMAQGPEDNTQLVFQVTGSFVPPFDASSEQNKQLSKRLADSLESDIAASYVTHRQNELGSTINQAAINALLGDTQTAR
jgi:peptidyl-prolyl cis-trans isomerase D